jgi:trk system potassium uptake protein TrkA
VFPIRVNAEGAMKIIVIGAGEVGTHICSHLAEEGNDIILIEADAERAEATQESLDVLVVQGNGASMSVLEKAGARGAAMIVAVTDIDETNIVACVSGKALGIPNRIARVKDPDYYQSGAGRSMQRVGVDLMINPDLVAAQEMERLISLPGASDVTDFGEARVRLIGAYVREEAPAKGVPLKDFASRFGPQPATVVAVVRGERTIIPDGNTWLEPGDHVYMVGVRGAMRDLMALLGNKVSPVKNVMIVGASPSARTLARHLTDHKIQVKLIEKLKEKAERTACELEKVLVLHGDGTDVDLLRSEQVEEMDAFIAASNDEETNIMSCVLARHMGAKKTIAVIRRANYVPLVPAVGIDAAVSVRLTTAATIMKFVRRGDILGFAQLKENEAELLELVAHADNPITKRPLVDLDFPESAVVGSIIRGKKVYTPRGDTQIEDGDRVVVFALPDAVEAVQKLFS